MLQPARQTTTAYRGGPRWVLVACVAVSALVALVGSYYLIRTVTADVVLAQGSTITFQTDRSWDAWISFHANHSGRLIGILESSAADGLGTCALYDYAEDGIPPGIIYGPCPRVFVIDIPVREGWGTLILGARAPPQTVTVTETVQVVYL